MAIIKGITTDFFSTLSFVAVFGSGIRDGYKSRIRDKQPASTLIIFNIFDSKFKFYVSNYHLDLRSVEIETGPYRQALDAVPDSSPDPGSTPLIIK